MIDTPKPRPHGADLRLGHTGAPLGAWELVLLAVAAAIGANHVVRGFRTTNLWDNDPTYYFGIARHILQTHRYEDPTVWHFLYRTPTAVHAPFDYWAPLTTLLILPSMAIFGATVRVASTTIAALSALSVLLLWFLICFVLPLRHRVTQLLALLLFGFAPVLGAFRANPESIVPFQVGMLVALIAFALEWDLLALGAAFCMFLARTDGTVDLAIVSGFLIWRAIRGDRSRRQRVQLGLAFAGLALAYVGYSFWSFGSPLPSGSVGAGRLRVYEDVFLWDPAHRHPLLNLFDRFTVEHFRATYQSLKILVVEFRHMPDTARNVAWLICAASGPLLALRHRSWSAAKWLTFSLLALGTPLVIWLSPTLWRARVELTPAFVLGGALGLDGLLEWLKSPAATAFTRGWGWTIGQLAGIATAAWTLWPLRPYELGKYSPAWIPSEQAAVAARLSGEGPTMTDRPWQMLAYGHTPAVILPSDGDQAFEEVLRHYQIQSLALFEPLPYWLRGTPTETTLKKLFSAPSTTLGAARLTHVPMEGMGSGRLFRVDWLPAQ